MPGSRGSPSKRWPSKRTRRTPRRRWRRSPTTWSRPGRRAGPPSRSRSPDEMPQPLIDTRSYQQLVDQALARIPVHNPEWTNFNRSDPGVTLLELFAFLMESVAYRSNQIPERNRMKFLSLLGVPLSPAASARGIVTFDNPRGPLETVTLNSGIEVRAGSLAFRTGLGLDVLPFEARPYVKRPVVGPSKELLDHYRHLYASYTGPKPRLADDLQLYESIPLESLGAAGAELQSSADESLWVALLLRSSDPPEASKDAARRALAGKTLSLGVAPVIEDPRADLAPGTRPRSEGETHLDFQLPLVPPGGV